MKILSWLRIKKEERFCKRMMKNSLMLPEEAKEYMEEKYKLDKSKRLW